MLLFPVDYNTVSLSLIFALLITVCLGVTLFGFIPFEIAFASWSGCLLPFPG